jgi:hypothetical protein
MLFLLRNTETYVTINSFSFQDLRHDIHLEDGSGLVDDCRLDAWNSLSLQTLHSTHLRRTHTKNENSLKKNFLFVPYFVLN